MRGLLPESINRRRDKIGFDDAAGRVVHAPEEPHLRRSSSPSPSPTARYFDQTAVLHAFEGWIKGTNSIDSMTVWRMLNLELWLQEFFDEHEPARRRRRRPGQDRLRAQRPQAARPRARRDGIGRAALPAAHRPLRPRGRPRGQDPRLPRALLRGPARGRRRPRRRDEGPLVLLHLREDRRHHPGPVATSSGTSRSAARRAS